MTFRVLARPHERGKNGRSAVWNRGSIFRTAEETHTHTQQTFSTLQTKRDTFPARRVALHGASLQVITSQTHSPYLSSLSPSPTSCLQEVLSTSCSPCRSY